MQYYKVARYVGCNYKTIVRERQRDDQFDQQLRRAEMAADLNPLEAMRRAAATHWRAAAWMLERDERRSRANRRRREAARDRQLAAAKQASDEAGKGSGGLDGGTVGVLLSELLRAVHREVDDPLLALRVEARLEDVFRQTLVDRPRSEPSLIPSSSIQSPSIRSSVDDDSRAGETLPSRIEASLEFLGRHYPPTNSELYEES